MAKHEVKCMSCGRVFDANRGAMYYSAKQRYMCKKCYRALPEQRAKRATIWGWVGAVFFVLSAAASFPSLGTPFFLLAAALCLPVEAWQTKLAAWHIKGWVKAAALVVLLLIGAGLFTAAKQ